MDAPLFDSSHISTVTSFSELVQTKFQGNLNALCWHRTLEGDFEEIVHQLTLQEDITEIYPEDLAALSLSEQGQMARDILLNDLKMLTDWGASPVLNLLKCYARDTTFDFITTDVYSFHVDRSPIPTDTFLCTYYGAASDLVANEEAVQKVVLPEIREKLIALHDGPIETFDDFLKDHYFDLHYQALPEATITNLGQGHLWRLAVDHPEQQVLACIHRAPVENEGEYRLLLIC